MAETIVYKYKPRPTTESEKTIAVDPPPKVTTAVPPAPAPMAVAPTVKVVTGTDARRSLSKGLKDLWSTDPALLGIRSEEERIGRTVTAPAYRAVAERTGFSGELRKEARRLGLRRLLTGVWGTSEEE